MGMPDFAAWSPADWSAAAAWATFLAALIAVLVAFREYRAAQRSRSQEAEAQAAQLREAQGQRKQEGQAQVEQMRLQMRLAEEQARPYVVVSLVPVANRYAELSIRNLGQTAAKSVRLTFDPPEVKTALQGGNKFLGSTTHTEGLPTLVPGQELRTLLEDFPARAERDDLPLSYSVTVTYSDARGQVDLEDTYTLDFGMFYDRGRSISLYDVHHVADALRDVRDVMKRWGESANGPLSVVVRDGHRRDQEAKEEYEEFLRERAAGREAAKADEARGPGGTAGDPRTQDDGATE